MSYLEFDKEELINLEYALSREVLRSNRAGSYTNTTIINCNTRKYHGLLICPFENLDGGTHVLLSSFDETVVEHNSKFRLGIHKFPGGIYHPAGHKYIQAFDADPIPKLTFRVGSVELIREGLLIEEEERFLLKYTLSDAQSPVKLQFQPFLAFRNVHTLSKANVEVTSKSTPVPNGIKIRLYKGYPYLFMQFSKQVEFVAAPDWFYNIEYPEEQKRGYEYQEDLLVPGYFEVAMKKGDEIVFAAGLKELAPTSLKSLFQKQREKRIPRNTFENCLINSAQQFLSKKGKKTKIIAGFPWFGHWSRDTFVSLPGLTLAIGDEKSCKAVLDTMAAELKNALFPNLGRKQDFTYTSVDAPLWFIWAIQQYEAHTLSENIWKDYGKKIKTILEGYRQGTEFNIKMHDNGLVYAGVPGEALTWMDAKVSGKPVTPRIGYNVEINALWYNAVCYSLALARKAKDKKFISAWENIPELTKKSFLESFWNEKKSYLADYINADYKDWAVRPNQLFAASLDYTMLNEDMQKGILDIISKELLTAKGLRTLSPQHPDYKGIYEGNQAERDAAYHQGTVWPWLLGHYCQLYLNLYGKSGLGNIRKIYANFEEEMKSYGIGSISEVFDGNPPHRPGGAISQAWSVAELLRIKQMIDKYQQSKS